MRMEVIWVDGKATGVRLEYADLYVSVMRGMIAQIVRVMDRADPGFLIEEQDQEQMIAQIVRVMDRADPGFLLEKQDQEQEKTKEAS